MYQCPNCGGRLKFDIPSQQMACEQCDAHFDPYAVSKENDAEESTEYDVTVFKCPQCGGEILSTDNTVANFCSFCGASTILTSRLSKEKKPNYIIPFSKTKEDCKKEYKKMMKRAWFAPKELKDEKYIDGFRGIYMPYWAYHITQQGMINLKASKDYRRGDYIYTDHYNVSGQLDCQYKGISYDASSSFDDNISEAIAPFDVKNMNGFTPSFLSGFYADTSDVASNVYKSDAENIAVEETYDYIKGSTHLGGAHLDESVGTMRNKFNTRVEAVDRTMFPVWFLSYRNKDRVAYATVNGQTGKVSADLPVSIEKYFAGSLLLAVPIFILLNLFFTLRPQVTLGIATLIALITIIMYAFELNKIKRKDLKLDDRGAFAGNKITNTNRNSNDGDVLANQMADGRINSLNNNKSVRKTVKAKNNGMGSIITTIIIIVMIALFIEPPIMSFVGAIFEIKFGTIISAICLFLGIIITIATNKTFKLVSNGKMISGSMGSLVAMAVATLVLFINPVSDLFYYAAVIIELIAIMVTAIELIKYYNVLATRKLPQFDNYNGGDDNA